MDIEKVKGKLFLQTESEHQIAVRRRWFRRDEVMITHYHDDGDETEELIRDGDILVITHQTLKGIG